MAIKCPSCGFENPDGFAFCGQCGKKLSIKCPNCGADVPPGFAFCGQCGTRIKSDKAQNGITQAKLAQLKSYIADNVFQALPPAPLWQKEDVARTTAQLQDLLRRVVTYLPQHLVDIELASPDAPRVGGKFLDGTLLFADISGFTALSERLTTLGKQGAEQIVMVVNRYFSAMLDVLFSYGGDLFKFGGDALLAFFPGYEDGHIRALQAAWAMQQAMVDFHQVKTSLGTFPLQMKIGMHRGTLFAARVGTAEEREFIVTGEAVNVTAKAESSAVAGQILLSPDMYAHIRGHKDVQVIPGPSGHHIVENVSLPEGEAQTISRPQRLTGLQHTNDVPPEKALDQMLNALDRLTPYLPPGLLPRLVPDPNRHETSGEHRLVAVLFANFTGTSELIARLGAGREHDIAETLNAYFTRMQQAVARYGGVINKVDLYDHGDKLMALFGAPVAHEDDAERAVRAALEMQKAIKDEQVTALSSAQTPLSSVYQQRIGVSTGMVFAGHVGATNRHEYTVMGDEVNLAARLMSAAEQGDILLASYVQRKVRMQFEVADRGEVRLKGKSKPVPTYTIVGRRAQPEPVRGIRGLRSALVGRAEEQARLRQAVADVCMGRGSILSLIGEAGLGKSRMMAELRASVVDEVDLSWVEGRCLSYTQQVSYSAFNDVIRDILGILDIDNEYDIRDKLQRRLAELFHDENEEDIRPYLAHFLNLTLSAPETERVSYLSEEALQQQVFRAIITLLEQFAKARPLVLVFDDLHWADSASLALLERCLSLSDRVPIFLALLYRPLRSHGCWELGQAAARNYPHRYTEIQLSPLDIQTGQDQQMVCNLLDLEELPPALGTFISRAEGNPFYVEEIIRSLIDQGIIINQGNGWYLKRESELHTIPDTLQGLIIARLDQLMEEARRTLQLASVIGRTFRYEVLSWIASAAALTAQVDSSLANLQRSELIRERARLPELEYIFKHVMVRDVAYESMLIRDRQTYHGLIGQHLEDLYSGQKQEEVYELLAHHYSLSSNREKALTYLIKSGDKARAAYANPEAIALYRRADRLAEQLGQADTQVHIAEGWGDVAFHIGKYDEALACYERAMTYTADEQRQAELYQRIAKVYEKRGEYETALKACADGIQILTPSKTQTVEMARLLIARSRVYQQQGQNEAALKDGKASLSILEPTTHYLEIAQAHNTLGLSYRSSQPDQAIEQLEQGLKIMERIGDEYEAARVYGNLAILYYQTDLNRSADYFNRVLDTMQRLGNVWGEAQTYQNLGIIHYAKGEYEQAVQYYLHSLDMKQQLGDTLGIADCHINLGEVYRAQRNMTEAIAHLEQGLAIAQDIGTTDAQAECHRQLAECYLEIKDFEHAITACHTALNHAKEIGDHKEEGLIYRVLGNTYVQSGAPDTALEYFEQSVAILRELNYEFDLGNTLCNYAQALTQLGQSSQAREHLSKALALFQQLDLPQETARTQSMLDALTLDN